MATTTTGPGDDPKTKPGPAKPAPAKYKQMKSDTTATTGKAQALAADPTKPLSPTNVLMTEHADGTYRQWGEDPKTTPTPVAKTKKVIELSDKARGLSNTYYPARDQRRSPEPPTQKPSANYYPR